MMQDDLNTINNWLMYNKLTMNYVKTNYMIIGTRFSVNNYTEMSLKIGNSSIQRVESIKYLGITIQQNLKWDLHIDYTCLKINAICGVLNRIGHRARQEYL